MSISHTIVWLGFLVMLSVFVFCILNGSAQTVVFALAGLILSITGLLRMCALRGTWWPWGD